jgi:hypothetical protein
MAILDPFFTLLPVAHEFANVFLRRPYKPAHLKSQLDHSNLSHGDKTLVLATPQIASWIQKVSKCLKSHFFGHFWPKKGGFPPMTPALFFGTFGISPNTGSRNSGKKGGHFLRPQHISALKWLFRTLNHLLLYRYS